MNLAAAKPGQPGQFVEDADVDFSVGDRLPEPPVLLSVVLGAPRDNIDEPLDVRVRVLLGSEILQLIDLALGVLFGRQDTGLQPDCFHTSRSGGVSIREGVGFRYC